MVLMALVGVAVGLHAGRERLVLLVQDLLLLLAHGAAQQVGFAGRVTGQLLRGEHHVLLVHQQAIALAEDVFQRLG